MKFLPIHTDALRSFGYTEEEARFLYLVATHSGYFTCRQFLHFIQTKPGKRSVAFARKVIEKKHAKTKPYLRHGRVFHLFSRNLYEAIGRENVRFRRVHSTQYVRMRLIALDFILRNQDVTYLETEEQKLTFFCDQMGKKILPHKRYSGAIKGQFTDRYFVDKFPMFYNPSVSLPPVVTLSFIDPGFETMESFRTHLDAYMTLFTKLSQVRLYYIATRDTNFERARKLFHETFQRLWNPDSPFGLLQYFRTRRLWDEKQFAKLSNRDIEFLNLSQERFGDPGIDDLYKKWRVGTMTENAVRSESIKYRPPSAGQTSACQPLRYSLTIRTIALNGCSREPELCRIYGLAVKKREKLDMKRKRLLAVLIGVSCCSYALAKNDVNPADYPLSAKVVSFEESSGASVAPVMNSNTGVITGSATTYNHRDREEFQINGVIYITSILRGCSHCQDLVLGKVYHAQMGPIRFRWHKYDAIQYLQLPTKGTEFKVVTLQIIGKRLPES